MPMSTKLKRLKIIPVAHQGKAVGLQAAGLQAYRLAPGGGGGEHSALCVLEPVTPKTNGRVIFCK